MTKRFIEHDLPLAEISEQSAREKFIRHGHPSTLHIWWARRPLAASRATAFAALIDDPGPHKPEERKKIRKLIEAITPWDAVKEGNNRRIEEAQAMIREQYGDDPPKVLDPFAGGGAIPLEALRLGCETYASDYNPVAVFIEKATLQWPQQFGVQVTLPEDETGDGLGGQKVNLLAYLVEKCANVILEEARDEIGRFYPEEKGHGLVGKRKITQAEGWIPVGYLWARTIPCQNPTCHTEIPLIGQYWLCKKKDKRIGYRPVVDEEAQEVGFEILEGDALEKAIAAGFDPGSGTSSRANAECLVCGQVTKAKHVRKLTRDGKMGERMVAVVLHHPKETGKKYRLATHEDEKTFEEAARHLEKKVADWPYLEDPLPSEAIPLMSGTFNVPIYGLDQWSKLFNARQKLSLLTFLEKIKGSYQDIQQESRMLLENNEVDMDPEALAKAVMGYLAIVVDRLADKNASLVVWDNTRESIQHVFGRQALPMVWDFVETNVFSGSSGDWSSNRDWVLRFIEKNAWRVLAGAQASRRSATELPYPDNHLDAILTDPPYYNSVPYADLSDFFYVWLKRSVGEHFPDLFSTPLAPKSKEIVEMAGWDAERYADKDKAFFERMLGDAFKEMHRVLKPDGIAVIVYAHKTTEGWETMLNALCEAGFVVTGSWPVHTEMKTRLRAAQSAALASSIYMVCRKTVRKEVGFWNDIQPVVKQRVEEKLGQFWDQGVITGGDFFISAIGPGMEEYSRYERVETYNGEEVSVLDLLQYIREVATNFLAHRLLKDIGAGAIDKEAQFYLTYRWTFKDNKVEYDAARKIASAEGVNLESLWGEDGFVKKSGSNVRVLGPEKRRSLEEVETVNMVNVMHRGCHLWESGRKNELTTLLNETGYAQNEAFWRFCQAVAECLESGSKEKQLLEGLVLGKEGHRKAAEASAEEQGSLAFDETKSE